MGIRTNVGVLGSCAVTLIVDDGKRIVVDVGHFGNRDAMLESMKSKGFGPQDVDMVMLTHIHWDHCLNVDLFKKAEIFVGEAEIEKGNLTGKEDIHAQHFREYVRSLNYHRVKDDQSLTSHVKAISTPGHSVGHMSILFEEGGKKTVVVGDAVPNLRAYRRGVPDLIFFNTEQAKASVQRIKDLHAATVIPGHDSPFNDDGYLSRDNFNLILRTEKEENLIVGVSNVTADKPQVLIPP
jgi:glyoxylase-like metal-dependent hydrolase (beta-lactamase superfamily II)